MFNPVMARRIIKFTIFPSFGFERIFFRARAIDGSEPIQDLMWTFFDRSLAVAKSVSDGSCIWIRIGFGFDQAKTYSYYKNLGRFTKGYPLSVHKRFVVSVSGFETDLQRRHLESGPGFEPLTNVQPVKESKWCGCIFPLHKMKRQSGASHFKPKAAKY